MIVQFKMDDKKVLMYGRYYPGDKKYYFTKKDETLEPPYDILKINPDKRKETDYVVDRRSTSGWTRRTPMTRTATIRSPSVAPTEGTDYPHVRVVIEHW